jgi:ribose/xylose/arabinose/galactoside ABC-type transport system permease subunit
MSLAVRIRSLASLYALGGGLIISQLLLAFKAAGRPVLVGGHAETAASEAGVNVRSRRYRGSKGDGRLNEQ